MARRAAGFSASALILVVAMGSTIEAAPPRDETSPRKGRHSLPARMSQSAPDRTGSIAKAEPPRIAPETAPAAPSPAAPALPISGSDGALVPVLLPNASRKRMIACGESWQAMKMKGSTGDDCWRDYALKCLVAKDDPKP